MTDGELLARFAAAADEAAFAEIVSRHAGMVHATCLRVLGDAHLAEDAAQAVFLVLVRKARSLSVGTALAGWLFRTAEQAAFNARRARERRARREREAAAMRTQTEPAASWADVQPHLGAALSALPAQQLEAVVLRYLENRPVGEVAREMRATEAATEKRLSRALATLRERLARRGVGVPAVALGAMLVEKAGSVSVPAGLVASIQSVCLGKAAASTAAAQIGEGIMKAMLWAKVKVAAAVIGGVLILGGGAATVTALAAAGPEKPPELPKAKFATPVWAPDARWKGSAERFIGSGAMASEFLGGKAGEAVKHDSYSEGRCAYNAGAGPYGCTSYDPATGQLHLVAGASRGLLDGPFSRARFGGSDYVHRPRGAGSPDGRYVFITEPWFNHTLRRMDLVKQEIRTVPGKLPGIGGMAADSQGRLLVLVTNTDKLVFIDGDGKQVQDLKLDMQEKVGDVTFPCCLNLDEKNNRVYGSGYGSKKWYIWYWDLKDGSFHGVLPIDGEGKRKRNEAGPFKGTDLYNEMGTWFGPPDDPEKNFLYVSPNDCMVFFRLDLAKQEIWACTRDKEGLRFIGSGVPAALSSSESWASHMDAQGDIVTSIPFWHGPQLVRFPRVK